MQCSDWPGLDHALNVPLWYIQTTLSTSHELNIGSCVISSPVSHLCFLLGPETNLCGSVAPEGVFCPCKSLLEHSALLLTLDSLLPSTAAEMSLHPDHGISFAPLMKSIVLGLMASCHGSYIFIYIYTHTHIYTHI